MTAECQPTSSSIYRMLAGIVPDLAPSEEDSAAIAGMKNIIQKDMMTRFAIDKLGIPKEPTGILGISAFVDPRFKYLRFLPAEKRESIQDKVVSIVQDFDVQPDLSAVKTEPKEDCAPPSANNRLLDLLAADVVDLTDKKRPSSAELELEAYKTEPLYSPNPLDFWKSNAPKFPRVARLARRYLAIPATEVASERSFSAAGQTVTKLRASLDASNVDRLTFLHHNKELAKQCVTVIPSTPNDEPIPVPIPAVAVETTVLRVPAPTQVAPETVKEEVPQLPQL